MVLESELAQMGVFGLWTVSNLSMIWWLLRTHREDKKEIIEVVSNNNKLISILNERVTNGR